MGYPFFPHIRGGTPVLLRIFCSFELGVVVYGCVFPRVFPPPFLRDFQFSHAQVVVIPHFFFWLSLKSYDPTRLNVSPDWFPLILRVFFPLRGSPPFGEMRERESGFLETDHVVVPAAWGGCEVGVGGWGGGRVGGWGGVGGLGGGWFGGGGGVGGGWWVGGGVGWGVGGCFWVGGGLGGGPFEAAQHRPPFQWDSPS